MARPIKRLMAEPEVVEELRRRSRARTSRVRDRQRAEIILLRLEGVSVAEIAVRLETTAKRVSMWSKRFETRGLAGLEEAAGRGRKSSIPRLHCDRGHAAAKGLHTLERAQHGPPRWRLA